MSKMDKVVATAIIGMRDAIFQMESNSASRDDKLIATGELKAISKILIALNHRGILNIEILNENDINDKTQ